MLPRFLQLPLSIMLNHHYQVIDGCKVGKHLQHLEDYALANFQQVQPRTNIEHEVNFTNIGLACHHHGSLVNYTLNIKM